MAARPAGDGRLRAAVLALGLLGAASGCGYHLAGKGSTLPDHVRRIAVPMFENRTGQPDVAQRLTEAVVDQFVARGGYTTTAGSESADALFRGTVNSYRSVPIVITEDGNATRYEIVVQLSAVLRDLSRDEVLWQDEHFTFRQQYDVEPLQVDNPYFDQQIVAIDQVSRDFARSVVATILEGF